MGPARSDKQEPLPDVVFVHLGSHIPSWLRPAIDAAARSLGVKPWLVVDSHKLKSDFEAAGYGVWFVPPENLPDSGDLGVQGATRHFRNGFWRHTTARFWALHDFQRMRARPLVHLESDVIAFRSFPLHSFASLDRPIAYPLSADGYAVASVFYSRSSESLGELLILMREADKWSSQLSLPHPPNDMTRLAAIAESRIDLVSILPTLWTPPPLHMNATPELINRMSALSQIFGGVFDAATLGQFLLGLDPRNSRGFRTIHTWRGYHALRPANFAYRFADGILEVREAHEQDWHKVFNLHNHSKDIRVFREGESAKLLKRRCETAAFGTRKEFSPWGLQQSVQGRTTRLLNAWRHGS